MTDCVNSAIGNCNFPNDLKVADVSACYKRGVQTDRSSYKLVSVLPPISKIFERLIMICKCVYVLRIKSSIKANKSKLLGVTIDSKLSFDEHIHELCGKVNGEVNAFSRLRNYLSDTQVKLLCKTTAWANFNYYPLIWLFSSKVPNNEVNRTHKRALRMLH